MQQAEVHRGVEDKKFVIVVDRLGGRITYVDPAAGAIIDVQTMKADAFAKKFVLSNQNPAHAATVWLNGHKKIADRARARLDIISQTEYKMTQEAQGTTPEGTEATAPAKKTKKAKVATGEAKAPKVPKEPKIDPATGLPIPPKERKKLVWERPKFANTAKFTYVADPNPRKQGTKSYDWFTKYKVGGTVAEAIAAGAPRADIGWCIHLGFLKLDA